MFVIGSVLVFFNGPLFALQRSNAVHSAEMVAAPLTGVLGLAPDYNNFVGLANSTEQLAAHQATLGEVQNCQVNACVILKLTPCHLPADSQSHSLTGFTEHQCFKSKSKLFHNLNDLLVSAHLGVCGSPGPRASFGNVRV